MMVWLLLLTPAILIFSSPFRELLLWGICGSSTLIQKLGVDIKLLKWGVVFLFLLLLWLPPTLIFLCRSPLSGLGV